MSFAHGLRPEFRFRNGLLRLISVMPSDEDLSAESLQLQPYTVDARWAQIATAVEC